MILDIYAIKDELAGIFSNPFCLANKTAQRTFSFMAKEKSEIECKDQNIYYLGQYDSSTGQIDFQMPTPVYNLEQAWAKLHGEG